MTIEVTVPSAANAQPGIALPAGPAGLDAYGVALLAGYTGTRDEWLATLAYQTARGAGFSGSLADWLLTLKGGKGDPGLVHSVGGASKADISLDDMNAQARDGLADGVIVTRPDNTRSSLPAALAWLYNGLLSRFFDDGLGGPKIPWVKRARNYIMIDEGDDVTGNGTSIDTPGLQRILDKARDTGRPILSPYDATFVADAPLIISGKPVSIKGAEVDPGTLYGARGRGSWIRVAHLGKGFYLNNTGYAGKSRLLGFGTFRDQPAPISSAFAPLAADFDVVVDGGEVEIDMTMLNPSKGVLITRNGGSRATIRRLRGQPMQNFVQIEQANDKTVIGLIDAWPYWYNNDFANGYTARNCNTLYSKRADGLQVGYIFGIFQASLLRYGYGRADVPGVSAEHSIQGAYADGSTRLLAIDPDARYTNLQIDWATHFQDGFGTAADYGIEMAAADCSVAINHLKANNLRGGFGRVTGAGSVLAIGRFHEGTFNRAATAVPGWVAPSGAIRIDDYHRANPVQTAYGTGAVVGVSGWVSPNGGAARTSGSVTATLDAGSFTLTTDTSGRITIPHNAGQKPNAVDVRPLPPACDYRLIDVTVSTIVVALFDSSGAALGSGVAVTGAYRVGMQGASIATSSY